MKKGTTVSLIVIVMILFSTSLLSNDKKNRKKTSPPIVTGEIMLGYEDFNPGNSSGPPAGWDHLYQFSSSTTGVYRAPLHLPKNATITEVMMRAKMNYNGGNDSEKLLCYIYRTNDYGTRQIQVTLVKSNYNISNTNFRTKSRTVSIATTDQPYYVWLVFPGTDTTGADKYEVSWVKVSYTTP